MKKLKLFTSVLILANAAWGTTNDKAPTDVWYQPPYRIMAGDVPLDIGDADQGFAGGEVAGYAAPFYVDLYGEGRRDLVVGSFGGRFRVYRNSGTTAQPRFERTFSWLKAGDDLARVENYCCAAVQPELIDIDGDGIPDLTCGCYMPGCVYWFKGLGGGRYATRQMLTFSRGQPIFSHLDHFKADGMLSGDNVASSIAWADWGGDRWRNDLTELQEEGMHGSADPRPDLVLADGHGEIFILHNEGPSMDGRTPIRSQPMFSAPVEIRINGERAVPEDHATVTVADWDGDGLMDIIAGSWSGTVYFFRNSGKPGKPEFKTREVLIGHGAKNQWAASGEQPQRGIKSYIHFVHLRDRKALLIGDWSYTTSPRSDLTPDELDRVKVLREKLAAVDQRVGFDPTGYFDGEVPEDRDGFLAKRKDSSVDEVRLLERELIKYTTTRPHGFVWVYMAK